MGGDLPDNARSTCDDPVSDWKRHDAGLQKRAAYLNEKRYSALKYRGPGTDFTLGWRTITCGWAAERRRAMGSIASPICRRKRCSPCRTRIARMER